MWRIEPPQCRQARSEALSFRRDGSASPGPRFDNLCGEPSPRPLRLPRGYGLLQGSFGVQHLDFDLRGQQRFELLLE